MAILILIGLLAIGIGALTKGEIQISKKRKITGKTAKTIGVLFIITAVCQLFVSNIVFVLSLTALCFLISLGLILFSKGLPTIYATLEENETTKTKCPKCNNLIDITRNQMGKRSKCPTCEKRIFIKVF